MIILGSSSLRRIELIKKLNLPYKILKPDFDESLISKDEFYYAQKESFFKAQSLISKVNKENLLLCMDTIVFLNGKIYNKPKDKADSFKILKELNNQTHEVITGYTIIYQEKVITNEVKTLVTFKNLSDEEILEYIENVDVSDKAGSYSYQNNETYTIVKEISGSYYNVIGFPLEKIIEEFTALGLL